VFVALSVRLSTAANIRDGHAAKVDEAYDWLVAQ
jgi:hypothetical protein